MDVLAREIAALRRRIELLESQDDGLSRDTWGIVARLQGLIVMPEGSVADNGTGTVTFGSTLIIMNPAAGSWIRVAQGSYTLATFGALVCDLPPTAAERTTVTPTVLAWSDNDRIYDGKDRFVLAQRAGGGNVFFRFGVLASAV